MAKKTKVAEEFRSSYGVPASVPDPVDLGDTHTGRRADQATGSNETHTPPYQNTPIHAEVSGTEPTRSELISGLLQSAYALDKPALAQAYDQLCKLGGFGEDPHVGRAADQATAVNEPETYREDVSNVLGGELDEATVTRATNLFAAAVRNRVIEQTAKLEETLQEKLEEALADQLADLEDTNVQYMDYVTSKWLEENQIAVQSSIRTELAEEFLKGLRDLFVSSYIDIPEDKVDVVEALAGQVETLKEQLAAAENKLIEQNQTQANAEREQIRSEAVDEVASGLTMSQRERLAVLAESVDFADKEDLLTTLQSVADNIVKAPLHGADSALRQLEESAPLTTSDELSDELVDPTIASIAKYASRLAAAK